MVGPRPDEYASVYSKYVSLVPDEDILAAMSAELARSVAFLSVVPDEDASVCHDPYTWTTKQVVGHLTDSERVFGYRALRFARRDRTPLPGFDECLYAQNATCNVQPLAALVSEFEAVRNSTLWLFKTMNSDRWREFGTANGANVSVRALAYIILGHERHHMSILRKRLPQFTRA